MTTLRILLLAAFIYTLFPTTLLAENLNAKTIYVDDKIWITVRTEPSQTGEKIAVINSGTRLTLIQQEDDSEYAQVRLSTGETGWALKRHLSDSPIAAQRLEEADKKIEKLQQQKDKLKKSNSLLKKSNRTLNTDSKNLNKQNKELNQQLDELKRISSEAVDTREKLASLKQQNKHQSEQLLSLKKEKNDYSNTLITFSAGFAITGLLIGLYIGSIPSRRNKNWSRMP